MSMRVWLLVLLGTLVAGPALAESGAFGESDAEIVGAEEIQNHKTGSESIEGRESGSKALPDSGVTPGSIGAHEGSAGSIDSHEGGSEGFAGREARSKRLEGEARSVSSAQDRLAEARAKLQAARERHAREEARARSQAPASAATLGPDTPAASEAATEQYGKWVARIDVAQHRIEVARAVVNVWDESYAEMMRSDYPRGDAREKLIQSRERAKERLAAEESHLPQLVAQARAAGVPEGVLELHAPDAQQQ